METIGRYKIVKKLGSGGMGDVYLAEDPVLDRMVALKVLRQEFVSDRQRLSRFVKEAKAASALNNVGVAHIYEIGVAHGVHFIAMQFVDGITLSEKIRNQPIPLPEILDMAIQIADALDEAHSKGIIHRDIKPQNLMLTPRGQTKILDFGIAKRSHQTEDTFSSVATDSGVVLGTIYYMSPEQALGKGIDNRSDIFSLGVVLYEICTGTLPFQGGSPVETLQKILNDQPAAIPRFNPNIPHEMERIIMKCIEKDPERRYQSVRDLLVDLKNLKLDTESGKVTAPVVMQQQKSKLWQWTGYFLIALVMIGVGIALIPKKAQKIDSLAVLPFKNESSDRTNDYLTDGFTDSVINTLSQIPDLKVLSRGTVFSYKGKEVDPREVGRELKVDAIVTGRVVQQGEDLLMTVSLVRASDGSQIWGEQYTRKVSDILSMQTEVSRAISERLPQEISGETRQQMDKEFTSNVDAYQLYLKGRFYLNKRTHEDFEKAIDSFQQALRLDPNYAPAHSGLADAFILLGNWGFIPAKTAFPQAKVAAQKALSIDPKLAEAHTSLAYITSYYDWDWDKAEKSYESAIELNPNYSTAHQWYALYLTITGQHDKAMSQIRIAQQLDPLSLIINANSGFSLYYAKKYDEAIQELQKTIDLDPEFALPYQILGYIYGIRGERTKSIATLQKAFQLSQGNVTFQADLAWGYAVAGEKEKAQESLNEILKASSATYVPPFYVAAIYTGLHQNEEALKWLDQAYEDRSDQITYIAMDPRFDSLRKEPHFNDLIKKIGL